MGINQKERFQPDKRAFHREDGQASAVGCPERLCSLHP